MADDRLKRLTSAVRDEEEDKGLLDKLISRLKPKEEAEQEQKKGLDFKKVDVGGQGVFGLVGKFYSMFTGPVESTAKFLSNFPLVRELGKSLKAAGMSFTPETYLIIASCISLFFAILSFLLMAVSSVSFGDWTALIISPLVAIIVFLVTAAIILVYPVSKANERAAEVDRALPFALRQLATQLKAGVSFYKSLTSIADADYGLLSEELDNVVRDLDSGLSNEEALKALEERNKSAGLRKAILQIIRAMRSGGNLSMVISEIADDVSFETRQQVRDFTEKLNFINILYIMVGVVMPVAVAILSAILQIPLFAGTIPGWFVYAGFGLSAVFMIAILYVTKKMEPAAW